MTTTSAETTPAGSLAPARLSPEGYDPESLEKVPVRGRLRRLLLSILLGNVGIFALWGAIPGILLPLQVEDIDPKHKAARLAVITTVGAFAALVAQPVAGMLSDRTRSRFGRRAPWMVGGALVGGLGLVGMASADALVQLGIAWVIVQVAFNFTQGPLSAVMPDRVPRGVRGTFAAVMGLGTMIGALGGQVVGSRFADHLPAGYLLFAGLAIVVVVLFVVLNPDRSNAGEPRAPFELRAFLRTFWVSPRSHPDFAWGFVNRLLLYVGYFLVSGYQLYILQDYVGLGDDAVKLVPVLGLVGLVGNVVTMLTFGPLSDRIGRRKPFVLVSGLVMAVGLLVPWISPTVAGMVVMSLVLGLGMGAYMAVDSALMSEVLPAAEDFGKDLGVLNIAATLPQTVGPALAGGIVVVSGGYTALFPIGVVVALLGSLAVLRIRGVR